jgi:hypothetical protein
VILEVDHIEKAIAQLGCPKCSGSMKVILRTVCIASSIGFECNDETCGYLFHAAPPAATTIHVERDDNFERSTDYAVNVLYVLGFLAVGDGCTEAARILGLLGLPNDTTMESRSFTIIENRVGPLVQEICDEVVLQNMIDEVKMMMEASDAYDEHNFDLWKRSLEDKSLKLSANRMPKVQASYDMAWQQKGSGHVYNSLSGHGVFIGMHSRKVIALVIKCKTCNVCSQWKKKHGDELDCLPHKCWKNHDGSSGSMESAGCLELVVRCFDEFNVVVDLLCCDDDSSIRADCQWSNADYLLNNNTDVLPMVAKKVGKNKGKQQPRPDKGKLPRHIPEPNFVADPNHRRKGLTGELIKLDTSNNDKRFTMTRMDSTRIGKNFGYMARTLKDRPHCEFIDAASAALDHHFDRHEQCGDWCKRKHESEEQRRRSPKYYRCMTKDAKLYAILREKISRFITMDKLLEMAHGLDTNMNEAFNNICTWFAPKNKVYAGSGSLQNRIAFAVGINSLGVLLFTKKLFRKMGITVTDNVEHYLTNKETNRLKKIAKMKSGAAKKEKNKRKYDKLKDHTRTAKMEFHKRQGTYRKGMNMEDPFGELLNGVEPSAKPPAAKKAKPSGHCQYCGKTGHLTKRSKNCTAGLDAVMKFRREDGSMLTTPPVDAQPEDPVIDAAAPDLDFLLAVAAAPNTDEEAADDCDRFDSLPFNIDLNSDVESDGSLDFHDAHTWDTDDESEQDGDIDALI